MVELHLDIVLVALEDLLGESRLRGRCRLVFAVAEGMALLVGLSGDVEAILIAQIIPARVVWIVAGAHGVDVEPFHDLDVLDHALRRDDVAAVGIHLVAVGTFDVHGLAVDEELGVLDLYLAEAYLLWDDLYDVAFAVFHDSLQGEEIGSLSRPFLHVAHHEAGCALRASAEVGCLPGYNAAVGIEQTELHDGVAFDPGVDEQLAVLVVVLQVGCDADVFHLNFRVLGKEIALTGHTGETPEVLILIHGAVAPAEGLEGDEVFAGMQILGDVELSGDLRVFGITYILSVDKEIHVRRDAAEVGDDLLAVPRRGKVDDATVRAYVVVLHGHARRRGVLGGILRLPAFIDVVLLELIAPGQADVDVFGVAVAIDLPDAWDVHRLPRAVVEIGLVEVLRALVGVPDPSEFPRAFEREVVGRLLQVAVLCLCFIGISEEVGVQAIAVDLIHLLVVPLCPSGHRGRLSLHWGSLHHTRHQQTGCQCRERDESYFELSHSI